MSNSLAASLVILACFFWGLIFVIPSFIINFSPLEITLGRYLTYGLFSVILMIFNWKEISSLCSMIHMKKWGYAILFTLVADFSFYIFLIMGMNYSSPPAIALVLGLSPITIALFGRLPKNGMIKTLTFPIFLICLGLALVNMKSLILEYSQIKIDKYIFGLICGSLSLWCWTWFVVKSRQFLKNHPDIEVLHWTMMLGVSTFGIAVLGFILMFLFFPSGVEKFFIPSYELSSYLIGAVFLGLCCSWIPLYLWNSATRFLPLHIAGLLTVFETLFGLIFLYITQQQLPSNFELIGIFSMLSGVTLSIHFLR